MTEESKMHTTILFGGLSKERLVSVATAQALHAALPEADLWFWDIANTVHRVAPDVLLVDPPQLPDSDTYRGRDAYTKRFKEWAEPLGHFHVDITEFVHTPEATMAAIDVVGEATASGIPMQYDVFNVFRFRNGRISEYRLFLDREAALVEAGLA